MENKVISERKENFASDISVVWDAITNIYESNWRSDIEKTVVNYDGTEFVEYTNKGFETTFKITIKEKDSRYELTFENKNMTGRFYSTFAKVGNGCEVTFTETVFVNNVFMKLLARTYLNSQQKKFCYDLKQILGEI